jgi:ligand-binding sensor domain-containing protein
MMDRLRRLVPALIGASFFFAAHAQQPWTIYNTSNSILPDNQVLVAAVDPANNKWVGTPGGLAIYDNISWAVYTSSNSGLPDNDVRSIAFDSTGNVWIGTFTGGLAKYNGNTWTVYNTANSGLPDDYVRALAVDGQNDLWIGTTGGLAKFDGNAWTVWNASNSQFISENITSITIRGNTKYIGTVNGGIVYLSDTSFTSYTLANSGLQDNTVLSIALDSQGNRWLATVGQGAMEHQGNNWVWYNPNISGIPAWSVYGVITDAQDGKYFATFNGIAKLAGNAWTVYDSNNSPLIDDFLRCIVKDHNGVVWAGSNSMGLVRLDESLLNGIEEASLNTSQFYPNIIHSGESISVRLQESSTVMIYDEAGRLCRELTLEAGAQQVLLGLAGGMYHAVIIQKEKHFSSKLVVLE